MRTQMATALLSLLLLFGTLTACQSDLNAPKPSSRTEQETSQTSQSVRDYTLDTNYSYQGVSIMGDANWLVDQTKDYNYYVKIDKPRNSHITIQTALHGQTKTLADAWAEYTNAPESPKITDSWENDGVVYNAGYYGDKYFMISGCQSATGKGFLLWIVFTDDWTRAQAEELFKGVVESLTYDPSQTTIDYKDAYRTGNPHNTPPKSGNSSKDTPHTNATYDEGMYKVGVDIPAGEYKLTTKSNASGYWEVTSSSTADASIIGNDIFNGSTYVTINDGQYLKLNRCYAVPVS